MVRKFATICVLMLACMTHTDNKHGSSLWVRQGDPVMGETNLERVGMAQAISSDGMVMVLGSDYAHTEGMSDVGKVRVFDYDQSGRKWIQRGENIISSTSRSSFGEKVAMAGDGNSIVIGDSENDGKVYVYEWAEDLSSWVQKGATLTGTWTDGLFGYSVDMSLDGEMIVVGSYQDGTENLNGGSVKAFTWDSSSSDWAQLGSAMSGEAGDYCGAVVKLARGSKDAIAVFCEGAPSGDWSGSLHCYRLNFAGTEWDKVDQHDDVLDHPSNGDYFGYQLDISDDGLRIAAGSYDHEGDSGENGIVQVLAWASQGAPGAAFDYELHSTLLGGTDWVVGDTSICLSGDGMTIFVANGADPDNLGIYTLQDDDNNPTWTLVAQINEPGDLVVDGRIWEGYSYGYYLACTTDGTTVVAGMKDKNSREGTNDDVGMVEVFSHVQREFSSLKTRQILELQEYLSVIDPLGWDEVTKLTGAVYFYQRGYGSEHLVEFDTWFRIGWGDYSTPQWETLRAAVNTFVGDHYVYHLENVNVIGADGWYALNEF